MTTEAATKRLSECSRHQSWYDVPLDQFPAQRCTHMDNRFVIEVRAHTYAFIDYVEDLPDGDVLVEAYEVGWDNEASRDALYVRLVEKMSAGEPPEKVW